MAQEDSTAVTVKGQAVVRVPGDFDVGRGENDRVNCSVRGAVRIQSSIGAQVVNEGGHGADIAGSGAVTDVRRPGNIDRDAAFVGVVAFVPGDCRTFVGGPPPAGKFGSCGLYVLAVSWLYANTPLGLSGSPSSTSATSVETRFHPPDRV